MTKVKFLREFGGRETGEIHYPEGHEMEMNPALASDLAGRDIVDIVQDKPKKEKAEAPETDKPKTAKAKAG